MTEKKKILYIDDEKDNLAGFSASFRTRYRILVAENTISAKEILESHPDISIIFCDQRMPGKTGTEFFEEIKQFNSLPVRILITAYTDIEMVIEAVNKGNIFKYIKKPWSEEDILRAIEDAAQFYTENSMLLNHNRELEKAYAELDKFANDASHDLRDPLSGVLAAIEISRKMSDEKDIKALLGLMEKSILRLENYISDIHLHYSERKGELTVAEIDFRRLSENLKDIFRVYIDINNINFQIELIQTGNFRSDETLIKMILNNLIANAIKYQKKTLDGKRIKMNIAAVDESAEIIVTDNGEGIPESRINEIFDLYSRASSKGRGYGIGLHNVQNAVQKLGGKISVRSTEGEGTTFNISIPNLKLPIQSD